ncbi:hypothetical protein MBLNU459_g2539t1 [Dothideomycetes sp. NU459]
MAQQNITIDRLLNLVPDSPDAVLAHLQTHPQLASAQDSHGYSLLHAAVSYGHATLLRELVQRYGADINLRDEDGETPLFAAESVAMARLAVDELGADAALFNVDQQTCARKMADEGEYPDIVAYLHSRGGGGGDPSQGQSEGHGAAPLADGATINGSSIEGVHPPPPLPQGVNINLGTMAEGEVGEAPDPEFRRRIEELAARGDFEDAAGQAELRRLVEDAVFGMREQEGGERDTQRRRVE